MCFFLASPAAFAVSSAPWARTQFSRRIALTLPAIPVARVNAPVFINLDAYAEPISGTQYELVEQNGATATTVPAIAYAQPDGVCRTLYWKAAGTTAANATRTFYLYFNPGTDVPAWQFRNGMSGTYEEGPDETHSGIVHRPYKLTASRLTLQRCSNAPTDGSAPHMLRGRNSETTEWTVFHELTAPVVSPQSSFLNTWGLADSTEELWEAMLPVESPATDRNGPQVAMSFCLDSSTPIAHRTRVTHRLFDGQVASELVISHAPLGADPVQVTFGTRYLYWKNSAGLDRMTTDAGGDAALPATGSYVDTNRWAIVYRASSGDAIGMLSPRQAQIRVTPKTDYGQINDRWAYSYDGNVLRLIEAVGKRNEILPIFQSLAAGVNADAIETPGFDVTAPTEEQYFLPGDTLNVRIVGSAVDGVTAQLIRPDGSASDIALVDSGPGEVIMNPPMAIGAGTPPGVWTIKAASPQQSLTRTFTVLNLVPGADVWAYPLKTYRREVVLPADPAQARTDAPVFVDLSGVENIDLASVRVDEAAPGARPTPRSAAAYAEPSGEFPRAYWVAAGRTDATVERRFLLYYSKAAGATPYASDWDRAGASFGSKEVRVEGVSGKEDFYVILQGDQLKLQRSAKNMTGVPGDLDHAGFREENPAGSDCNTLTHLASGFSPFDGLRLRYALWGADADVAFTTTTDIQPRPFQSLEFDRNGPTAAFTATYHIDEYKPHTATTTYRVFQAIPLLEFAVDVQTDDGAPVEMAADYYAAREFYWNSAFTPTRMISDVLGDQPVNGDSLVRNWIILYDADQNAFGLFSFRPARLRVNTGKQDLQDLYNTSFRAGESQLYCALGPLANVQTLFAALDRPCRLGPEQLPAFDILSPLPGAHFIPGEDIRIDVAGPSLGADASLRVYFPDGSWRTHAPTTISGPHATFDLGPVAESAQFGAWTLRVTSNGVRRSRGIDVLKPQHPCVLFTPDELAAMRSRWSADPRYADMRDFLFQQCEIAYAGAPAPASPGGDVCQFGWNARSYAAATLMDPGNPASPAYTQRLWQDFDAILNWTNWNPARNNCDYFPAASYAVGEILPALVLAYDWHGDELDAAAKRRYAERLADCADALMELGYVDPFPPLPRNVNTIHNNKTISRQAALAGLDRLLAAEIPESRRAPWRARADQDYDLLRQALPADGSNHEGASYSAHSNESLFFWTETRRLNGDVNVYDSSPWFAAAPWFELYSMLPGRIGNAGGVLPFGNAAEAPFGSHRMTMGLLGARRRDPIAQWIAEFSDFTHIDEEEPMWKTFETMPADPSALPNWRLFPDSGTFVYRSDWTPQAMYFAEKCGPMWGGHEHPDSGAFVVYRNGFPYIAAPHYLLGQRVEDENILLANGQGLQGIPASAGGYSDYVPEESWGRIVQALGSPGYFNVLADPCKAYQPAAQLSVYTREFVGAPDVIVLRDQFALPAPSTVDLLFHGYKTDPETIAGVRYDPNQYPLDPVFKLSSGIYRLYPNETACPTESMAILDASRSTWSARIDPSIVVPDLIPGYVPPGQGRLSNAAMNAYTRGQMLRRTLTNAQNDSSVLLFHFRGDTFRARKWGDGKTHDGVVFTEPTLGDRLKVVWPTGGALDASEGLTVRGAMAMQNLESGLYGGRDLTYLKSDALSGAEVAKTSAPLTFVTNFAAGGDSVWYLSEAALTATFYHPAATRSARSDGGAGGPILFSVNGQYVTLTLPAAPWGACVRTAATSAATHWQAYQ